MTDETGDVPPSFEEARAELIAGLERAHELVCEAKRLIAAGEKPEPVKAIPRG